jgi:hypothetical protein
MWLPVYSVEAEYRAAVASFWLSSTTGCPRLPLCIVTILTLCMWLLTQFNNGGPDAWPTHQILN